MIVPEDITARSDRALAEACELQIASDELRRWASEVARANELLREWMMKHCASTKRFDTGARQP